MAEELKKKVAPKKATTKKDVNKDETKVTKKSTSSKPKTSTKEQAVKNDVEKRHNGRKVLVGSVISIKNNKTITVLVETYTKHPLYSKRFKKSKKFAVHDETNLAKIGDVVKIQETRPLSKTKHFRLVEIKSHAIGGQDNA